MALRFRRRLRSDGGVDRGQQCVGVCEIRQRFSGTSEPQGPEPQHKQRQKHKDQNDQDFAFFLPIFPKNGKVKGQMQEANTVMQP